MKIIGLTQTNYGDRSQVIFSDKAVFVRSDFQDHIDSSPDPIDTESSTEFKYTTAYTVEYSLEEWIEKNTADIDYIAMETGIDLDS